MAQVCLPSWNGLKGYLSCLFIVYCSGKSGLIVQTGIVQRGTARSMRTTRDGYPNLTTAGEASQGRQLSKLLLWAVQVDPLPGQEDGWGRGKMPYRREMMMRSVWP